MSPLLLLGLKLVGGSLVAALFGFLGRELNAFVQAKKSQLHSQAALDLLDFGGAVAQAVLDAGPAVLDPAVKSGDPAALEAAAKALLNDALAKAQQLAPPLVAKLGDQLPGLLQDALKSALNKKAAA